MQLIALIPNLEVGLYSSYTLDSIPGIGVSTNDIYLSMSVSGITTGNGDFSRGTFFPTIKNNRNTALTFYWSAYYEEVGGISEVLQTGFGSDFWGATFESGSGWISANGTWRPEIGILQKILSSCHNCPYTLFTTIHFSTVSEGSPFTPTPTPTNSYTYDRSAAVSYADVWAHERNSIFPNYGTTCGCNDCTNYISQILYNGNYPLREGDWNVNSEFQWWYRPDDGNPSTDENSKTWSAADWLMLYIGHYDDEYREFVVNPDPPVPQGGDFILLDLRNNMFPNLNLPPDGLPDHGRFLVGYGSTSTEQYDYTDGCGVNNPIPTSEITLLGNQHCTDRWHVAWDYNINFDLHRAWYIHVID